MRVHHAFTGPAGAVLLRVALLGGKCEQRRIAIRPGGTAVQTAHQATHFDASIEFVGLGRVDGQADHARREAHHAQSVRIGGHRQPPPMPPAVLAAIDCHILRADVHDARIRRMDLARPHDRLIAWEVHPLPGVAGIRAAIGPGLRASEHHARLRGMQRHAAHFHLVRQATLEGGPGAGVRRQAIQPPVTFCGVLAPPIRRTSIDVGHRRAPHVCESMACGRHCTACRRPRPATAHDLRGRLTLKWRLRA